MSPASCAHPEAQRTRLSSGRGYRCEVCRTVVLDQTQEICVSPKVDTVRLTKDKKAVVRLRKADKRRDELKTINDAADQFVKNWKEAETFGNDIIKLHQKFSDVFEASKPLLETVLDGFAHLRKGEKIQGHTTAKEWCPAVLGVSYERVRQLRTAKLSLAEPIVIISDNPQKDNQLPKSSAERRSVSARNAAETRKKNAEAKRGGETRDLRTKRRASRSSLRTGDRPSPPTTRRSMVPRQGQRRKRCATSSRGLCPASGNSALSKSARSSRRSLRSCGTK